MNTLVLKSGVLLACGAWLASASDAKSPESPLRLTFPGSEHHQAVRTSAGRIKLPGLYPGIDAVFYRKQGLAEYDFIVSPHADVSRIRIAFETAESVVLTRAGDVQIREGRVVLEHRRPIAYQDSAGVRRAIECHYRLEGDKRIRLELGNYDRNMTLVIDPVITSRFDLLGGGDDTETSIKGIAVDSAGYTYLTGVTSWAAFPETPGPLSQFHGTPSNVNTDTFVMKLAPKTNAVVWSVLVGGSSNDWSVGIAIDPEGNVYVGGYTVSPDFPVTTPPAHIPGPWPGNAKMYVFELNSQGTALVYSVLIGGSGYDQAYSLALASDRHVAVVGSTSSPDFPVTANAAQGALSFPNPPGNSDAVVVRLDGTGRVDYGTYLGGPGEDYATGVAFDSYGDMYVAGLAGPYFPTLASSFVPEADGGGFVSRLDHTTGQLVYSTYIPGVDTEDDIVTPSLSICADASQNAYVAGPATFVFPTTPGAFQTDAKNENRTAFVLELNPSGTELVFSTLVGGSSDDVALALALTGDTVTIAGITNSPDFPVNDFGMPVCNTNSIPPDDIEFYVPYSTFVASFDHAGKLIAAAEYGECWDERVAGITASPQGVLMAGTQFSYEASFVLNIDLGAVAPVQIAAMVDAASLLTGTECPLEIVSIFGRGLGPNPGVSADPSRGYFPTTLAGTQLFIGWPAPLLYVSDTQINAIVPVGTIVNQFANVIVNSVEGSSALYKVWIEDANPTIFTENQTGAGQGAILNQDGSVNSASNPAARGSVIQIFGTGGGQTKPAFGDGLIVSGTAPLAFGTVVYFAFTPANVTYSGAAPFLVNGVMQVNAEVPMDIDPGHAVPLTVFVSGVASQAGVTVAVK